MKIDKKRKKTLEKVNKEYNYNTKKYENLNTFLSFWFQLKMLSKTKPKNVLEIGPGEGILALLAKKSGLKVKTLDIQPELKPDIIADVRKIPQKDNTFDTVCAFQVLEHIPFEDVKQALKEIKRVSNKYIIISLPYSCFYLSFAFQPFYAKVFNPIFKLFSLKPFEPKCWNLKIPFFFLDKHGLTKTHAWELGRKNYPIKKIRKLFDNLGLKIVKEEDRIFYPYHRFFLLKK